MITRRRALLAGLAYSATAQAGGAEATKRRVTLLVGSPEGSGGDQIAHDFVAYFGPHLGTSQPDGADVEQAEPGARRGSRDAGRAWRRATHRSGHRLGGHAHAGGAHDRPRRPGAARAHRVAGSGGARAGGLRLARQRPGELCPGYHPARRRRCRCRAAGDPAARQPAASGRAAPADAGADPVEHCHFPILGRRSAGGSRGQRFGCGAGAVRGHRRGAGRHAERPGHRGPPPLRPAAGHARAG